MPLDDDDDEMPEEPEEEERALAEQLGPDGLGAIDATLQRCTQRRWLKVARVIADAMQAGNFGISTDGAWDLHTRRVIALVEAGVLEAQGHPCRPRFSEVRLPAPAGVETA
jgi:hypothetical protein